MSSDDDGGFRIDMISLSGAAGALVVVGGMLILLLGVPPLRWALLAVAAGVVFGAIRILRH